MQPLEPPDTFYLSAAIGWLELGNLAESKAELASVSPAQQEHPDVLEVRWVIAAEEKQWQQALEAACAQMRVSPERSSSWLHQAYALRRVEAGGLQQAWDALLPAYDKFPEDPTIAYNLACYACQMQQLEAARVWLKRAVAIGGKEEMRKMALKDPDLEPLWGEIREW